jgi:predicted amidophosphoribosyltransferase
MRSPLCGTCWVDLEYDADGMTCPNCGTYWDHEDAEDGAEGKLPEDWDDLPGLPIDEDQARTIALEQERETFAAWKRRRE